MVLYSLFYNYETLINDTKIKKSVYEQYVAICNNHLKEEERKIIYFEVKKTWLNLCREKGIGAGTK